VHGRVLGSRGCGPWAPASAFAALMWWRGPRPWLPSSEPIWASRGVTAVTPRWSVWRPFPEWILGENLAWLALGRRWWRIMRHLPSWRRRRILHSLRLSMGQVSGRKSCYNALPALVASADVTTLHEGFVGALLLCPCSIFHLSSQSCLPPLSPELPPAVLCLCVLQSARLSGLSSGFAWCCRSHLVSRS
jgi:hypothetical protein